MPESHLPVLEPGNILRFITILPPDRLKATPDPDSILGRDDIEPNAVPKAPPLPCRRLRYALENKRPCLPLKVTILSLFHLVAHAVFYVRSFFSFGPMLRARNSRSEG